MRISGPLLSLSARGKLGRTLIFSTKLGRPIVRAFHAPSGPPSTDQATQRASFKSIITEWRTRTLAEKVGWEKISVDRPPLSGYNIFLSLPIAKRNVRIFGNGLFGTFRFGAPVPK